ncbi:hypothetical protein RHGRI_005801 [Rhododendron griersonianum]|uniref:S1 motif domain-containing protein n=1 Tax=Rhododendron griersonianum TaxID=479676 RepID=A0AAV6LDZ5_9ERIC|nr:hypothetical protein RHGRI_005801 [Rhododendron griersonianum]
MDLGLPLTTASATNNPTYIRFFLPSYCTPTRSVRTSNVSFPLRKPSKLLVRASNDDPQLDQNEQMDFEFGRLMGEDPNLTLAKIMAKRLNPDVSYLEVEKSFNKRKGKPVVIEELPFDVERKSTTSPNGLNLVRPVPRKGVKFEADNKPIKTDVRNGSQLMRKPIDNARDPLPNIILRKPTALNEDYSGPHTSSQSRIKPNPLLENWKIQAERMGGDNTRGSLPNVVLRKPTTLNKDDIVPQTSSQSRIEPNPLSEMENSQPERTGVDSMQGSLPSVVLRKPTTLSQDDIGPQKLSQSSIKPSSLLEMENSQPERTGVDSMQGSLPNVVLRKPTTLNEDDIGPQKSLQLRIKPNSSLEVGNNQPVRTGVDNTSGSFPNVVLRKPSTINEDDIELRIEQNLSLEMGNKETQDSFSDITLLKKPDQMSGNLNTDKKQESDAEAKFKGVDTFEDDSQKKASIATEAANMIRLLSQPKQTGFGKYLSEKLESSNDDKQSNSGDDFKVKNLEVVNLSAGKVNTSKSNYAESMECGNDSLPRDFGLEDFSTTGLQLLEQSVMGSSEKISASETYLVDSDMKGFADAALQGKPKRLDQGVKATSNLSKRAVTRSNPESYGNVCELENFLATSTIKEHEDVDWKRMEDLTKTGQREKVEVISYSTRGFVVSFGSLIGFLPYRDVAYRWKFLAFESWLRRNGIDPSKYKDNLGIIGKYGIADETSLDSSLGPEIGQNVDVDISPDMAVEDLLRIYNHKKLRHLSFFVGQKMPVHVVLADRNTRRLIFSSRPKEAEESIEKKRNLMAKLSIGDVVKCCITKFNYTGVFVEVDGVPALIHETEVSWDATLDPGSYFKIGQIIEAKVHQLDFSTDRIHLSLKEMAEQSNEARDAIIGERDSLDGRSEAAQANTEWTEVESLIKELQQFEGIQSVSKGRFSLSPGLAPTLQVYMASVIENEYKLLARSGNKVQELLAVVVMGFGVWMSTHHDGCRKSLTLPVLGLGAVIFVVFIITNNGSGHKVAGLRYKEYQLQDYSSWFLKQLNNTHNWEHLRGCLVKSDDCNNLSKKYKTLKEYKVAKLTPIEAGCCRPPSECGYPAINASYYDLSFHPISSNKDCKLYKNSKAIKCYSCDSCKAGVAQYMKTEWRVVAIFNVVLFVVLSIIYFVGCCARRNAARNRSKV